MQQSLQELRVAKDYYTTKQVSEIYRVTQVTVCNWIRKGWLKAHKQGDGKRSHWRVHPQAIEDVEQHRDELIELSRKYWPSLLRKLHKI